MMRVVEAAVLAAVAFLFQRRSSGWFRRDKLSWDHSAEDDDMEDDRLEAGGFNEVNISGRRGHDRAFVLDHCASGSMAGVYIII